MSNSPYFSIGVTTFKRRELLVETLASILAQTFADFEVIVGNDDTTTPLTLEALGIDDPRIRIVNHAVNLGEIANMNELLALSRGHYFTWIADDDLYSRNFLQAIRAVHDRFGPVSCVFCNYATGAHCESTKAVPFANRVEVMSGREFLLAYLSRRIETLGCMGVFETQYLRESGGMIRLGNGFSPYSDNLLAINAGSLESVCYVGAPMIFFRTHSGSISYSSTAIDDYLSAQKDLCEYAMKIFVIPQLQPDMQQNLYELISHWCLTFMFAVLDRSQHVRQGYIQDYIRFLLKYAVKLRIRHRLFLAALALRLSLRHWILAPISVTLARIRWRRCRAG